MNLDEKVLILSERFRKTRLEIFTKLLQTLSFFFDRNRIFTIYKRTKLNNGTNLYWVEDNGKKFNGRFIRQELFALNKQFEK